MSKVNRRSTVQEGPGGTQIIKEAPGGYKKIVCPSCHMQATPQVDGSGKTILVCPRGHRFKSTTM